MRPGYKHTIHRIASRSTPKNAASGSKWPHSNTTSMSSLSARRRPRHSMMASMSSLLLRGRCSTGDQAMCPTRPETRSTRHILLNDQMGADYIAPALIADAG